MHVYTVINHLYLYMMLLDFDHNCITALMTRMAEKACALITMYVGRIRKQLLNRVLLVEIYVYICSSHGQKYSLYRTPKSHLLSW